MRSDVEITTVGGCATDHVDPEKVAMVRSAALSEPELAATATLFKLLGDPTRTRLLYALLEAGELCVCDLAAATGVQEATASHALRLLRMSGVVTARREGRLVFYRLADAHVRMLLDLTREHVSHAGSATDSKKETA
ncbi:ArsR/SmtB family transcription factor [Naumannella huperziae]